MTRRSAIRVGGTVALALAGAFGLAVLAVAPGDPEFGYDSAAYLAAADRLRDGARVYPDIQGGELDRSDWLDDPVGLFLYPPPVAVAFVPLSGIDDGVALRIWYGVLIAVAALVGLALLRRVTLEARPFVAAVYVSYLPLLSELRFGNLNLLTLALVLAAWRARQHAVIAGPLLAAGIGLKLLPLTLLIFLAVAGRGRIVVAAAGAGLLTLIASWPWLGDEWLDYLATLSAIGLGTPAAGSNIIPELLATPPARYVLPALAVLISAAAGLLARRARAAEDEAFAVALAAAPLFATSVWYPYLVFALPLLLAPRQVRQPGGLASTVIGWLAIQARMAPLPLLGLSVLLVTRLAALARRDVPGTAIDRRPPDPRPELA